MNESIGERIAKWAGDEAHVKGLTLIGSQVRAKDDLLWRADAESDWDFQIITSKPRVLLDAGWLHRAGLPPRVYAIRRAAIGGVPKIAALFPEGEADFVVLPTRPLSLARTLVKLGLHRRSSKLRRILQDLAIIIRPGWKFLKGEAKWEPFYRRVVADVPDPRLSDADISALAESFVCDYVWIRRKLARGELVAAQRMLHRSLSETNFRFLHELKLRRGERSFPEARRLERIVQGQELQQIAVSAPMEERALLVATERMAETMRNLCSGLIGETWSWPLMDANSGERVEAE